MRAIRPLCTFLLACAVLGGGRGAEAAIIYTAPLDVVVAHSTHIVLGRWDAASQQLTPLRWYRGSAPRADAPGAAFTVESASPSVGPSATSRRSRSDGPGREGQGTFTDRSLFFLEALDGRLHMTGLRPGDGFSAHASVRLLTSTDHVFCLRQVINPGGPEPVEAERATWAAFEPFLVERIGAHPYVPPPIPRTPLTPAHRASFFAALDGTLDWYQGGWPTSLPGWGATVADSARVTEVAGRLERWAAAVPQADRAAALEALRMLATATGMPAPGRSAALGAMDAVAATLPEDAVRTFALRTLRHAPMGAPRAHVARMLLRYGRTAFEEALATLEARILQDPSNAGTCAYQALKELGQTARAEAALERASPGGGSGR